MPNAVSVISSLIPGLKLLIPINPDGPFTVLNFIVLLVKLIPDSRETDIVLSKRI